MIMKSNSHRRNAKGFSLVEVVIAIGIVAILLSTFMAVFTPAQKNIKQALSVRDVNRMASTLEKEMSDYHSHEVNEYTSAFDKAYLWIKDSSSSSADNYPPVPVFVYQYKAMMNQEDPNNGRLLPYDPSVGGIAGKDFITKTVARRKGDPSLKAELAAGVVTGPVYVVRMTQLLQTEEGLEVSTNPGTIEGGADSKTYEDAQISFQAEFFRLKANQYSYVNGNKWDFKKLSRPVATHNMAVRR